MKAQVNLGQILQGGLAALVGWLFKTVNDLQQEVATLKAQVIAYQDSMYTIIANTQNDITDIKEDIVYILERLDYEDGTWDSIRYVKGGAIDKHRNK